MLGLLRKFDDWLSLQVAGEVTPAPASLNAEMDKDIAVEARRDAVLAIAEGEREERRRNFEVKATAAAEAYRFKCHLAGEMLILRVGKASYAVNSIHLVKVSLTPGSPVADTAFLGWTENFHTYYDWTSQNSFGWPRGYGRIEAYEHHTRFPAPSEPATITFAGADLALSVPHARAEEVYAQVIDALAGAPLTQA